MLWFPSGNGRNSQALKVGQKLDAEGEERLGGGQLPSCTLNVCKSVMCLGGLSA